MIAKRITRTSGEIAICQIKMRERQKI